MARRLLILGSTGSIGVQALEVVERSPDLEVVGLSAASSWRELVAQAEQHGVSRIALVDPEAGARAAEGWTAGEGLTGPEGLGGPAVDGARGPLAAGPRGAAG